MRRLLVLASTLAACGRLAFDPGADQPADARGDASDASGATGPASCRELLATDASLLDGVYSLDLDGDGPGAAHRVYCNMTTAGGGWTLVGRSTPTGTASSFGWSGATGSVDDDSLPYSLGHDAAAISFTELLVGSYSGSKTLADHAYTLPAEANFVTTYATASLRSDSTTVIGSCVPSPFVTMLLYKGQTDLPGVFWFRDSEFVGGTPHGLFPSGWDTYYAADCTQGGLLHTTQGLIFVR